MREPSTFVSTRLRRRSAWNIAYASCGACLKTSVAFAGSVITKPFICEMMSRSWGGGSVFSVREIESGQFRLGCSSAPGGKGGSAVDCGAAAATSGWPLSGMVLFAGALSPAPLSLDQSTRSFLPISSKSLRLRTAEAAESLSANCAKPKPLGRPVSLS